MKTNPESYQIANYNINPPPIIEFDEFISNPRERAKAVLVERDMGTVIEGGFVAGDMQAILPGIQTIEFTGLKLAQAKDCVFVNRFNIGNNTLDSAPFKLASSYRKLPAENQSQRPYKRGFKADSEKPTDVLKKPATGPKEDEKA